MTLLAETVFDNVPYKNLHSNSRWLIQASQPRC